MGYVARGRRQLDWEMCGCLWHIWYLAHLGVISVSFYPGSQGVINLGLRKHHPVDLSLIVLFVTLASLFTCQ